MEHAKKLILVSPDLLNRVTTTRPTPPENKKLHDLEEQLSIILNDTYTDDVTKMKRYSDLMQRYMVYDKKAREPPTVRVLPETRPKPSLGDHVNRDIQQKA